jgi:hypothetical protein
MPGDDGDNGNGDQDGNGQYQFEAGAEACDACQSLDGVIFSYIPTWPHDGCQCNIVPVNRRWQHEWSITWQSVWDKGVLTLYVDIEVTCCDGTQTNAVITVPFEIQMAKLREKYSWEQESEDDCFSDELFEEVIEAVYDDAMDLIDGSCDDGDCGVWI